MRPRRTSDIRPRHRGETRRGTHASRPNVAQNRHTQPAPEKPKGIEWGRGRVWGVGIVLALVWLALWGRLFFLQIINGAEYAERARRQHLVTEVISGRRGAIYDRNGSVMARSVEHLSVSVRPSEIADLPETTLFLSKTLGMNVAQVRKMLTETKGFVWVARKVDDKASKAIAEAKLRGVYLTPEYERVYPNRQAAGQLLGFVGLDNKGLEGLEASFQKRLSGTEARQLVQRDARGRRVYLDGKDEGAELSGQDLHLTIDLVTQIFAEEALEKYVAKFGARWGGCIVVDIASAEVRAWAQYPFFNPNSYQSFSSFVRRDKLALDALEQGSTMKSFLIAAALQEKVVTRDSEFNCEQGKWPFRSVLIRDTHPYGVLPVNKILRVSSNIGCAKIGLKMGAPTYWGYLDRLGFGRKTGLPLMGENPGILRAPAQWHDVDTATASFGQSFSATSAQVAQAYLCLVSGGVKRPLKLVRSEDRKEMPPIPDLAPAIDGVSGQASGIGGASGETGTVLGGVSGAASMAEANSSYRVFSEDVCKQILEFLREVVEGEGGTGGQAAIPGLHVGGKTGTAQKADSSGRYGAKRVGSFVGVVPADNPRYLIVTVFDEPVVNQYGGVIAAPVFREVAMRAMAQDGYLPAPEDPFQAAAAAAGKLRPDAQVRQEVKKKQEQEAKARAKALAARQSGASEPKVREYDPENILEAISPERVPNVKGQDVRQAVEVFGQAGFMPKIHGSGSVIVRQLPEAGGKWPDRAADAECALWLGEK